MNTTIKMEAIEEIIELLTERQTKNGEEGFTRKDLQNKFNYSRVKSDKIIDRLLEDEYIEPTTIYRQNRVGIFTTLYGYKLTAKAQDKAAAQS